MKKKCENCAHCDGRWCLYILHTEHRRPCHAEDGCDAWIENLGQYDDCKRPPAPHAYKMDNLAPKALELYNAGLNDTQIAEDLNITTMTVRKWRERMNLSSNWRPTGRPRRLSEDEAMSLYKKGLTDKQIAHLTGTYFKTVANWRYRHGLPANKKRNVGVEA